MGVNPVSVQSLVGNPTISACVLRGPKAHPGIKKKKDHKSAQSQGERERREVETGPPKVGICGVYEVRGKK